MCTSKPKAPPPPPPPPPPPEAPQMPDEAVQRARGAEIAAARRRAGAKGTLMTGSMGDTSAVSTGKKTLLGQ